MRSAHEFEEKLNKYCNHQATEQEIAEVESWFINAYHGASFPQAAISLEKIEKNIWKNISASLGYSTKRRTMYPPLAKAAVAALLIGGSMFCYNWYSASPPASSSFAAAKPLMHQRSMATLKLSNGEVVYLSTVREGEIYNGHGIKIFKERSGRVVYSDAGSSDLLTKLNNLFFNYKNQLEVPEGGECNITFRDGSKALIGPGSNVSFDPYSKDGRGLIKLEGIAEFDVAKDPEHPFRVMTASQEILVMGTQFNVRSYPGETDVTELVSGSVSVTSLRHKNARPQVLKPGQRAISYSTGIQVENIDSVYFSKLSKGYLVFRNAPLKEVLQLVGRWYNVKVVDTQVKDLTITATLFFNLPLTDMVDALQHIPGLNVDLQGQTLTASSD